VAVYRTAFSAATEPTQLVNELCAQLQARRPASVSFVFAPQSQLRLLGQSTSLLATSNCWVGGSSCLAGLTEQHLSLGQSQVAVLQIDDAAGAYGVGFAELTLEQPLDSLIRNILRQALEHAGRPAERPSLIWVCQPPGHEELVLHAIQQVVGVDVPIFGGSSADDEVSGLWCQFAQGHCAGNLFAILAMFPSDTVEGYFTCGYGLAGPSAVVTAVEGRRLLQLDGRPARDLYFEWLGRPYNPAEPMILARCALTPLARVVETIAGLPILLVSHPATQEPDGSLTLFSRVELGERVHLLQTLDVNFSQRAAMVAATVVRRLLGQQLLPKAALITFCAGCMLTMRSQIPELLMCLRRELPEVPFVVTFFFGEQGIFADGQSRHGNLMISAVVFGGAHANT